MAGRTLAPLFTRSFAGSTDRECVTVCIVCRRGPVFTLAGVLCAGSVENGDIFLFGFPRGFFAEPWASAIARGC